MKNFGVYNFLGLMALLSIFTIAGQSQPPGPPPGGGPGGGIERLFRFIDLTSSQRDQIKAIHDAERSSSSPIVEQIRPLKEQMKGVIESSSFDAGAARSLISQIGELEGELALIHAEAESKVFNLLTSDQKAKLANLESQDRPGPPPPPRDGPPSESGR